MTKRTIVKSVSAAEEFFAHRRAVARSADRGEQITEAAVPAVQLKRKKLNTGAADGKKHGINATETPDALSLERRPYLTCALRRRRGDGFCISAAKRY